MLAVLSLIVSLGLQQAPPPQQPPAGRAGQPPAQTPARPAVRPQGPYEFTTDIGAFIIVVKADKATAFDSAMSRLRQAMLQSKITARVQQANSWRLMKSSEKAVDGNLTYIWLIDPVAKETSYNPIEILQELKPADVQSTYDQLLAAIVSMTRLGLREIRI